MSDDAEEGPASGSLDELGEPADDLGHMLGLGVLGAAFALAMWRALPRRHRGPAPTAAVSAVAAVVGYLAGYAVLGPPFDFLASIAALGLVGGAGQALAMRQDLPGALAWILASVIAYAVGGAGGVATAIAFGDQIAHALGGGVFPFAAIVAMIGAVAGLLSGVISGVVLVRLARSPAPAGPELRSSAAS